MPCLPQRRVRVSDFSPISDFVTAKAESFPNYRNNRFSLISPPLPLSLGA